MLPTNFKSNNVSSKSWEMIACLLEFYCFEDLDEIKRGFTYNSYTTFL